MLIRNVCIITATILLIVACKTNKIAVKKKLATTNTIPKKITIENKNYNKTVSLKYDDEKHLKNIRQLTFGGDNAEAYFSFDNQHLVLQRTNKADGINCDQIYFGKIPTRPKEAFEINLISTGKGRTTCSYFMPKNDKIIFASTHSGHTDCPPVPERRQGDDYVWPLYPEFEIYVSDLEGNIIKQLTDNQYYDAEATVSPNLDKIVFTSTRSGDLDLYTCNIDGRNLVAPTDMELFICDVDGNNLRQITNLGNANWAPFMHPSGKKVLFSSNHKSNVGFPFHLYMINLDGTDLEQITYDTKFDAFPMFSPDGTKLVWSSNRNNGGTRDTNVFIADWVD